MGLLYDKSISVDDYFFRRAATSRAAGFYFGKAPREKNLSARCIPVLQVGAEE